MKLTAVFAPDLIAASDPDSGSRTISGLLMPFDEIGYTSLGPVTAQAGAVAIPDDAPSVILDVEHDHRSLIGRASRITETERGLEASFEIVKTRAGDDALEEIRAKLRTCLSVELADVVLSDQNEILSSRLTGAGLVLTPAFESARLAASKQKDTTPKKEIKEMTTEQTETVDLEAAKPSELGGHVIAKPTPTLKDLSAAMADAYSNRQLTAALADIIPANFLAADQPAFIGKLWDGRSFQRRVIPRFGSKELTSMTTRGWKWENRPEVGPYEGNKTAIPTNQVSTVPVEVPLQRIAGGHDIDRAFKDFPNPEFWDNYWAAMTESYAKQSDGAALAALTSVATQVTLGAVPEGVTRGLVGIVDGLLSILNETDTLADTAFIATDLWRDMILTKHQDRLAYLDAALGFEEGTLNQRSFQIIPESRLEAGQVLVSTKEAATIREYGGGAPIRVEAYNVPNGGVDAAVFGYLSVNVHDERGLSIVSTVPAP